MKKQMQTNSSQNVSNFVIFKVDKSKVNIDVTFAHETLWLTQKQLAELFEVNVPAISKHLKNIFDTGELEENLVISKMETTATDGKVSALEAKLKAETEYEKYRVVQDREYVSDFDRLLLEHENKKVDK